MAPRAKAATNMFGFLADGRWLTEGEPIEVRAPHDGSVVGTIFRASGEHVEAAIRGAVRAFGETRRMPSYERQRILRAVAAGLAEHREDFARTMALESGKPIRTARAEIDRAVFTFTVAAEEAVRIDGRWMALDWQPSAAGRSAVLRRFPLGPIGAITPFNFPVNLVAHKWAPAMAAGCTVVHKPAPQTPLSALRLAGLAVEAGWPAGALNVLPLKNEDAERIVTDDRIKLLTFTGSARVGWELKRKAGKKRVALELGGNAAVVIHRDADLAFAAERCVEGGYSYAGQSCISVQRILVHRSVEERFVAEFVPRVNKLKVGAPLEESTDVGPMISEEAARRAASWVEEAVTGGARLLAGGTRRGPFLDPVALANTRPEMRVNCEEVFGPVATIAAYDDFSDALARVNDSRYGLQAGVFTNDVRLIRQAYEELEVGGVVVGDVSSFRIDQMPYGGVKDSGLGREGLRYAIEEMTEPRLLILNAR
jgi:acyl-CoA reductase-like NAD-dependent aldehyde dehydrogenase